MKTGSKIKSNQAAWEGPGAPYTEFGAFRQNLKNISPDRTHLKFMKSFYLFRFRYLR